MFAAEVEHIEAEAWAQLHLALPRALRDQLGCEVKRYGAALSVRTPGADTPSGNRTIGFGLGRELTEHQLGEIVAWYADAAIKTDLSEDQILQKPFDDHQLAMKLAAALHRLPEVEGVVGDTLGTRACLARWGAPGREGLHDADVARIDHAVDVDANTGPDLEDLLLLETGADEPYVLVAAVDLTATLNVRVNPLPDPVAALTHHPGESSTRALIAALRDRSVEVAVDAVHVLADREYVRAKGWHERALHPAVSDPEELRLAQLELDRALLSRVNAALAGAIEDWSARDTRVARHVAGRPLVAVVGDEDVAGDPERQEVHGEPAHDLIGA